MAEYNFNVQDPYAAQAADIARRQKMAEIMQAQALQPIEKFSYNGIEARISPYQGLAKMLQAYMGGRGQAAALEEQKALGEKVRSEQQGQIKDFMSAMTGTPETTVSTGPIAPELMTEERMPFTTDKTIPAVAPDRQKALALALQSSSPVLQSAGSTMLAESLKTPESAFGKIDPSKFTKESLAAFMKNGSRDFSLLEPLQKMEFQNTGKNIIGVNPYTGVKTDTNIPLDVSVNTQATLNQQRELSDRAFNQLSASQKATLQNEAARIGISASELFYNTGQRGGGGFQAPNPAPSGAAPVVPAQMPAQMPVQPPGATPATGPRIAAALNTMPPQAARIPTAPVTSTAAPSMIGGVDVSRLPPKERNNLLAKQAESAITGKPTQENTLRDEYNSLTAPFRTVQDAYSKITNVANTGAGDMSLLYSYVKMLDPGSVVRESEFATAAASGSFGERVQGAMQRVMSGQRLPDTLRKDFIVEAKNIYTQQNNAAKRLEDQYTGIAQRNGLNPKNVIVNYAAPDEQPKSKPIQFKPNQTIPLPTVQAPTNRIPRYNPVTGRIE